ncbi:uncharacterized protein LOC144448890 [Glandiceps talaboti]
MANSLVWWTIFVLSSISCINGQNNSTDATEELVSVKLTVFDEINKPYERLGSYVTEVPSGSNAYDVMVKIEEENPGEFSFLATEFPGLGYYITAINGISENVDERLFWGFYIFNRFSDVGVSSYYPEDGDHIIWKYMTYLSVNVTIINQLDKDKVLGSYKLDYVNRGTSLYQVLLKLEDMTDHEFNFVTSTYARLGHYVEAIYDIWADMEKKLFWGIYNNDKFLDKGVDCFFPEHGDNIKFQFMAYAEGGDTVEDDSNDSNDAESGAFRWTSTFTGFQYCLYFIILVFSTLSSREMVFY